MVKDNTQKSDLILPSFYTNWLRDSKTTCYPGTVSFASYFPHSNWEFQFRISQKSVSFEGVQGIQEHY